MTLPVRYRPSTSPTLAPQFMTLDSWSAPAVDGYGVEWWLSELDGWYGTPDLRLGGSDRPLDHGQFDAPSYLSSRVITATGAALAPDVTTALQASDILSSLCWDPSQLYVLQVTEPSGQVRRAQVRLNSATKVSDLVGNTFEWQLQLKAPDPRRYDDTLTSVTLTAPTGAVGGISAPLTVPFSISTSGALSNSATVTNVGTIATRPVVTFAGPLVDPQLANVTAGRSLSFTITLAGGDLLVVDFDKRTVLLNGTASRSGTLTAAAAWWDLAPGGSDLTFTAGGGGGTATVTFRSAWL